MDLELFKKGCINEDPDIVVQKYIIDGGSYFFDEIRIGEEFSFKKDISSILQVHIRDIVIVGSGKLGFSLKPDYVEPGLYLYKKFDHNSEKKSDLDIAIVSSFLFDKELENLYNFSNFYKSNDWKQRNDFAKYILKGRLNIRLLPISFPLTRGVQQVQENYKIKYGRDINVEIYKSWVFFETYHRENIKNIQINLIK